MELLFNNGAWLLLDSFYVGHIYDALVTFRGVDAPLPCGENLKL